MPLARYSGGYNISDTMQQASAVQSYVLEGAQADLVYGAHGNRGRTIVDERCRHSTLKNLKEYVNDHYPDASYGVYPIENDSNVAVIIVANKYSPNNYWYVFADSGERAMN